MNFALVSINSIVLINYTNNTIVGPIIALCYNHFPLRKFFHPAGRSLWSDRRQCYENNRYHYWICGSGASIIFYFNVYF